MTATLQRETVGQSPVRFCVGDEVQVLNPIRLPMVEQVVHMGRVERVTERDGAETLYWVSGRAIALTSRVLRLVLRAR